MKNAVADHVPSAWRGAHPQLSAPDVDRVVAAIARAVLCCDCLRRASGCSDLVVRRSLLVLSRMLPLDTWTPCSSCGASAETYGIPQDTSAIQRDAPENRSRGQLVDLRLGSRHRTKWYDDVRAL
jgi:hypothetical protein